MQLRWDSTGISLLENVNAAVTSGKTLSERIASPCVEAHTVYLVALPAPYVAITFQGVVV